MYILEVIIKQQEACVFKNLKFLPLEESQLLPNVRAVIVTSTLQEWFLKCPHNDRHRLLGYSVWCELQRFLMIVALLDGST